MKNFFNEEVEYNEAEGLKENTFFKNVSYDRVCEIIKNSHALAVFTTKSKYPSHPCGNLDLLNYFYLYEKSNCYSLLKAVNEYIIFFYRNKICYLYIFESAENENKLIEQFHEEVIEDFINEDCNVFDITYQNKCMFIN